MKFDEFQNALAQLEWSVADFCRATNTHRNTVQRWKAKGVSTPGWVDSYLDLLQNLKDMHKFFLTDPKKESTAHFRTHQGA